MTKIARWLSGYIRVSVTGGTPEWCLNALAEAGVAFWDVEWQDAFTVLLTVYVKDADLVQKSAQKSMCTSRVCATGGFRRSISGLRGRLPLLAAVVLALAVSIVLPRFIWFYSVEGNERVPAEKIIRAVRETGVGLGVYGPDIDPQTIKNRVLERIPELSWLTVTQNGACAVIRVRERPEPEPVVDRRTPSDLVATQGGLVTELSVLEGSAAVKPGDIVLRGQVLISGRTDLERSVRLSAALGEVYARTWRELTLVTPSQREMRTKKGERKTVVSLQVGKFRIKISPGSGIFPPDCDKMTVTKRLTLPNGNVLPVALIVERGFAWRAEQREIPEKETQSLMLAAARKLALRGAIAGEIQKEDLRFSREGECDTLRAVLECREMIAGQRREIEYQRGTSE